MLGYLSAEIICSEKRTVSDCELRGKDNVQMSDKYQSIFSPQSEAIVFIILQIFFATRAILKILGNIPPRDAFRPIARERKYLMDYNSH